MDKSLTLITIGFATQALRVGSREHERMRMYASAVGELHIIVFTRRREGYGGALHVDNLHVYPTHSRSKLTMLFDAFRIGYEIVKARRGNIVLSAQDPFWVGLCVYVLARCTKVRAHMQVHGDYFDSLWAYHAPIRWFKQWLALVLLRRADHIRVASHRIARSLIQRGIPESHVTVLPIRPELEMFFCVRHVVKSTSSFTFLALSRFAPEKNFPLMIHAFARVLHTYPHACLRIVGHGTEEVRMRTLAASLGCAHAVQIEPWTEGVPEVMVSADTFLLTSDHEAYGLTIIEAMAVGLPVITTDVGCVGEVFKDDVHGIVVPCRDEDALVRGMTRMMTDCAFREECSRLGRARAQEMEQYTKEEYTDAWVSSFVR